MAKSHNFARKDQLVASQANEKPEDGNPHSIQIVVAEKPTNLSTNSAELNLANRFNLHSLERIRQESGGSQITSKKISLLKNSFKFKPAANVPAPDKSADSSAIQIVSKQHLALFNKKALENALSQADDSCEVSGIINVSDTQSSTATRGFSSLVAATLRQPQ